MYHTRWEKEDLYRILSYNMPKRSEELAVKALINPKNNTIKLPTGMVSEDFYRAIHEHVKKTGIPLGAKAPGKFAENEHLSIAFVPGNMFRAEVNDFEASRFFVYELQEGETLRSIAPLLFQLNYHYQEWNFLIRRSTRDEITLSSEDMYALISAFLQEPLRTEADILKEIRSNKKRFR